jgi:hypothetical protein
VKHLDVPARGIPAQALKGVLQGRGRQRGEQEPLDRLLVLRRVDLSGINGPQRQRCRALEPFGRLQVNRGGAQLQRRGARRSATTPGDLQGAAAEHRLAGHDLPQRLDLVLGVDLALGGATGTHQQMRPGRVRAGDLKQLIDVRFAIGEVDQTGLRTQRLHRGGAREAGEPALALLLGDGSRLARLGGGARVRIARPDLDVDQSQRDALGGERQAVVQLQPLGTVAAGVDRPQSGGRGMGIIIEAGGVLGDQHQRLRGDARRGGFVMGMQEGLEVHLRIVQKSIRRFDLMGCAIQRGGKGGGGMGTERLGQLNQTRAQPRIGEIHPAEFLLRPRGRRRRWWRQAQHRRRAPTQRHAPVARERQHIDRLGSTGCGLGPILATASARLPQALPIGRLVDRAGILRLIDKGFQQHRGDAIAHRPVDLHPRGGQPQHVRAQIGHRRRAEESPFMPIVRDSRADAVVGYSTLAAASSFAERADDNRDRSFGSTWARAPDREPAQDCSRECDRRSADPPHDDRPEACAPTRPRPNPELHRPGRRPSRRPSSARGRPGPAPQPTTRRAAWLFLRFRSRSRPPPEMSGPDARSVRGRSPASDQDHADREPRARADSAPPGAPPVPSRPVTRQPGRAPPHWPRRSGSDGQ